jgi:hypothetical protein
MKKVLKFALVGASVVVLGLLAFGRFGVYANDRALEEIKAAPDVVVLRVSGMT